MLWLEQNKLKSSIIYLSFFWGKKEGGGGGGWWLGLEQLGNFVTFIMPKQGRAINTVMPSPN